MVDATSIQDKAELLTEHDRNALPDGWEGGEAFHSGGGIWIRQFVNESKNLRVTYSLSDNQPGVGLERVSQDEATGQLVFEEMVNENPEPTNDSEKFAAALELQESA